MGLFVIMDPTELNKPEILYELKLRNQQVSTTQTADDLRTLLTNILSNPESPSPLTKSPNDLATDVQDITKCIKLIENCILSFPHRQTKIPTYLAHTRSRLNLIDLDSDLTADQLSQLNSLSNELAQLNIQYSSLTATPSNSAYHSAESVQVNSTPLSYFNTLTDKLLSISDGRHTNDFKRFIFKGEGCPRDFIQKIEEFATVRNITEKTLYNHIYDILSGIALDWFRARKDSIKDWTSFRNQLTTDFEITDYDYTLKKQIDNRKQGPKERVIIYFSHMESLFSKLKEPLSEKEKINILLRNLQPQYSLRMSQTDLTSLNALIESCKFTERLLQVNNHSQLTTSSYYPPYTRTQTFNSHAKTYTSPPAHSSTTEATPFIPEYPFSNKPIYPIKVQNETNLPRFTCPRCRVNTHLLENCTNPQKVCYRCGKKDFIFSNCPNCQKSKN